jgi:hypothetical protein
MIWLSRSIAIDHEAPGAEIGEVLDHLGDGRGSAVKGASVADVGVDFVGADAAWRQRLNSRSLSKRWKLGA